MTTQPNRPNAQAGVTVQQGPAAADRPDTSPPPAPLPDGVVAFAEDGTVKGSQPLAKNGEVAACPKCDAPTSGAEQPTRWKPRGERYVLDAEHVVVEEALIRSCTVCGFPWAEEPKVKGRP